MLEATRVSFIDVKEGNFDLQASRMERNLDPSIGHQDKGVLRMKPENDVTSCVAADYGTPKFSSTTPQTKRNENISVLGYKFDEKLDTEKTALKPNGSKPLVSLDSVLTTVKRENFEKSCHNGNRCNENAESDPHVMGNMAHLGVTTAEDRRSSNASSHHNPVTTNTNVDSDQNEGREIFLTSRLFSPEELPTETRRFKALEISGGPIVYHDDPPYLSKQVLDRFQQVPAYIRTSTPFSGLPCDSLLRSRSRSRLSCEHFSNYERGEWLDRERRDGSSPSCGNEEVNSYVASALRKETYDGPSANGKFDNEPSSVRLGMEPSLEPFVNHSGSHVSGKEEKSRYSTAYDEEPVWKQYQWYRDKKRPHSQQIRQERSEQTIFMQYNEIRHRRLREGRVVNGGAKGSELLPYLHREKVASSTSHHGANSCKSPNQETDLPLLGSRSSVFVANGERLTLYSPCSQGENSDLTLEVTANFERTNGGNGNLEDRKESQCATVILGNIPACKCAECIPAFSSEVKTDHLTMSPESDDYDYSPVQDDGAHDEISSTTDDDGGFSTKKFQRGSNDAAKVMRLNKIVRAVKDIKKRQQSCGSRNEQATKRARGVPTAYVTDNTGDTANKRLSGLCETVTSNLSDTDQEAEERSDSEKTVDELQIVKADFCNSPTTRKILLERREKTFCSDLSSVSDISPSSSDQETVPFRLESAFAGILCPRNSDGDVVCQVNGLFSLPGFKDTKFNITLGELKRRMNPPETLTRVEMISYVRQAKSSGRHLLDKNNIITANRSNPTILSRVCEGEAQLLADGIHKMNKRYMPLTTLARKTMDAYKDCSCDLNDCQECRLKLRRRMVDIEITRNSLKELQKSIDIIREGDGLQTYELASHNFGVANICNTLSLLDDYFKVLLLMLQDE